MAYKLLAQGVKRLSDGALIPPNENNADWRIYQKWLADGNTPLAQDPPPPPSQEDLDNEQARQYAKLTALRAMSPSQVVAWIDANINSLADAKDAITTLAVAVSVLSRRI